MKILMLVNWKVEYCNRVPEDKQPPDFFVEGKPYWFHKYFSENVTVDVEDIHTFPWLERFEKEKMRFYVIQTLRVLLRLGKYDLIVSHGMQSGIMLSLFRVFFKTKAKHIVFDIGSFNSAAESGGALKLMQFASKSIDGVIYHTRHQIDYYRKIFPWIVDKSIFIPYGADGEFFKKCCLSIYDQKNRKENRHYILCVGYAKRDWNTMCCAYKRMKNKHNVLLKLVGNTDYICEAENIVSVPAVPVRELMELIENALFCVVPLQNFNFSFGQMTLLQQMAMGKAVIAARVPSMEGYVEDGRTGLFYEPENAMHLAEQMERLLFDETLRTRLGENAYQYVHGEYNEKDMAERIEVFYRQICGF